jgi:hypothetical protein
MKDIERRMVALEFAHAAGMKLMLRVLAQHLRWTPEDIAGFLTMHAETIRSCGGRSPLPAIIEHMADR